MIQILNDGGWIMYAILSCSILALAVIIERLIVFLQSIINYNSFLNKIISDIGNKDISNDKIIVNLNKYKKPISRLAIKYIQNYNKNHTQLEEILYQHGSEEISILQKRLPLLSIIAHLTPLMGLLGTILGMITCFRSIEIVGGQVDVSNLAGGIWTALLTTAFGLIVAIPATAAHHFFDNQVTNIQNQFQHLVTELNLLFNSEKIK